MIVDLDKFKTIILIRTEQDTSGILIQSFVLSHFNYCPLVCHFTTARQLLGGK